MPDKVYLLPTWLRLWHWTNAGLMVLSIASGISLHFARPGSALIPFGVAQDIHTIAGIALTGTYGFFLIANFATGNGRQYVPRLKGFAGRLVRQSAYYLWGMFQGAPHPHPPSPEAKFNALQQIIYWGVMYGVMPVLVGSGLLFMWPELMPDHLFGLDGLLPVAMTHYIAGLAVVLFALGHVYLATTGRTPTAMIRAMVTGWHEEG